MIIPDVYQFYNKIAWRCQQSDVTNYNCNRRGLLTIKGNPAFRQVNEQGFW